MTQVIAEPLKEQPQAVNAGLNRLSVEFAPVAPTEPAPAATIPDPKATIPATPEPAKEPEPAPQGFTDPPKPGDPPPATPESPKPEGAKPEFELKDDLPSEEGSWKSLIEAKGFEVPTDYSEEKGEEIFDQLVEQKYNTRIEEVKNFRVDDLISEFPEKTQAQAKLLLDLLASGQTLEEYQAPLNTIRELRALNADALVRKNLEGLQGWSKEMVDSEMERLIANPALMDLEHKKLNLYLDNTEKTILSEQQQRIKQHTASLTQSREAKRTKDFNDLKTALDKMPAFMGVKLSDDNKKNILKDSQEISFEKLSPSDKAEFLAYRKYGKQFQQYLQSRATEQAELAAAKEKHAIPPAGGGGTRTVETTHKTGMDRLPK